MYDKETNNIFLKHGKNPFKHEIYYKDTDNRFWQQGKESVCISKYDLAIKMLEWTIDCQIRNGDEIIFTSRRTDLG